MAYMVHPQNSSLSFKNVVCLGNISDNPDARALPVTINLAAGDKNTIIQTSRRVGINTAPTNAALQIESDDATCIRMKRSEGAGTCYVAAENSNGSLLLRMHPLSADSGFVSSDKDRVTALGATNLRFTEVFTVNGVNSASDEKMKQDIEDIPEELLKAWRDVKMQQFRWKKDVEKNGDQAGRRFGIIAQPSARSFASHGYDAAKLGYYQEGESPSVNYQTVFCLESAYLRWWISTLEAKIAKLEGK